ncbi:MAG: (2Fe-2S)-binding protein [Firmicutes bacterium]|nr:(2Fe-2S)-binding protein [Bacillota bacterium]
MTEHNEKFMWIDGMKVKLEGEPNILQVIRKTGIELPTFCYHSDLSLYGACRMCVVEDDRGSVMAACSTLPKHGMSIKTNTKKLLKHRRMILELILANHCRDCTTCDKNDKCDLRALASRLGVYNVRFENSRPVQPVDTSSPAIVRDPSKCILCGDCVRVCDEVQGMGVIDFAHRGSDIQVTPAFGKSLAETDCVSCGQCVAVCPTAALHIKGQTQEVWDALHDPNKRVVCQMAPAVRVALGEEFGMEAGGLTTGKIFAALNRLGFDYVYDTCLSADLTVVEESNELLERLQNGGPFPMFSSCCPGWIKFVEERHPELLDNISTCKSPMQMLSAVSRKYFQRPEWNDGKETVMVAIMPCTAKKAEAARKEFYHDGKYDTDVVLTTSELSYMLKEAGIDMANLLPESPDMPFGLASGSGLLFGVTGGVTEAVIRHCVGLKTSETLQDITYCGVRGMEGLKEAIVDMGDKQLRIAMVSGLANTEKLIKEMQAGNIYYDFVEVMTCPGGCINGGGQPLVQKRKNVPQTRSSAIYAADGMAQLKYSDENPQVKSIYNDIMGMGEAHKLLHVHYPHPEHK